MLHRGCCCCCVLITDACVAVWLSIGCLASSCWSGLLPPLHGQKLQEVLEVGQGVGDLVGASVVVRPLSAGLDLRSGSLKCLGARFDFEKARPRQLPRRPSSPAARSFLPLAALLLRSRVRSETLSRAQVLQVAGVEVWWVFTQIRGLLCRHCHRRGLLSPFYWVEDIRCHICLL